MHRIWYIAMAVVVLGVSVGVLLSSSGIAKPLQVRPEVGYLAPDFTLSTLDGGMVTLSELKGKRVFLNFWASWCPPCRMEMPAIQSVYESKEPDVVFVAINIQEPKAQVRKFMDDNGYTFPAALDTAAKVASLYLVRAIPTSFVIDAEGVIRAKHIGVLNQSYLEEMLKEAKGS